MCPKKPHVRIRRGCRRNKKKHHAYTWPPTHNGQILVQIEN